MAKRIGNQKPREKDMVGDEFKNIIPANSLSASDPINASNQTNS